MRKMHLNLFIQGRGHHEAAWRHPKSSPLALTDIDYTVALAQKAEAHFFDAIFLADVLGLWNDVEGTPFNWLEPLTTLAAVAMATSRVGLIATCSTTYTEP
jgi:alkanesulfonate monooxygenase SsuD/methylene tetrahydromethanopterin reductase-like flavin-dependent oxidoreductase (luciferase family)